MNLEPAPRLPKWIFLAIDAGLLVAAFIIVYFAKHPYDPLPFISAVVLVGLAAIIGLIPFLIDYAADSAEYVQQERGRVNDQVQRLHAAGESLTRAAAQIKAVEEAVHKTAHAAENLPYRMQEKLAEFNAALAEKEEGDRDALEQELTELRAANSEQLKLVAEKIHKAATDWAALETATRKQLAAAEAAVTKVQAAAGDTAAKFEARLTAALSTLDTKLATASITPASSKASAPAPESAPVAVAEEKPAPVSIVESVAVVETNTPAEPAAIAEEAKPKKPRAPRKPRESTPESEGGPGETAAPDSSGESLVLSSASEETSAPAEAAASSDGATRLLATAYIGIGNKLFIRGEGPGLSWDKGVPMQFVSIGKWGWATHEAAAPVRCKLYKNDETVAVSGEVVLEPGKHVEVTALF
jgi:chemotaxis protein histidine kinase CheA